MNKVYVLMNRRDNVLGVFSSREELDTYMVKVQENLGDGLYPSDYHVEEWELNRGEWV